MSRGPGKLQSAILALLSGRGRQVFGGGGALTTGELCDELQAAGFVPEDRRAAMFRTYRAARSLYWRGALAVEPGCDARGAHTWSWSLPQADTTG